MNRRLIAMLSATWVIGTFSGTIACGGGENGPTGSGGSGGSAAAGGNGGGGAGRGGSSGAGGAAGSGGVTGSGGSSDAATPGSGGTSGSGGNNADASSADTGDGRNDASVEVPPSTGDASGGGAANPKMSFFITSETSANGNLNGIAMADAKCQRLAAAAGVGGKMWKAYLSTATENARDRIGAGPWFNFKGEMIAANLAQLHEEGGMKNNLTQPTGLTDTGKIVSGRSVKNAGEGNEHDVLTGSLRSGMVKPNAHCNNWTATTGSSGVGHADRMGIQDDPVVAASWNDAHEGQCNNTTPGGGAGRFYCFATN
jgi:hypothetical protein